MDKSKNEGKYTQYWASVVMGENERIADMVARIDEDMNREFERAQKENRQFKTYLATVERKQDSLVEELKRIRRDYVFSSRRFLLRWALKNTSMEMSQERVDSALRLSDQEKKKVLDVLIEVSADNMNKQDLRTLFDRLLSKTGAVNAENLIKVGYALKFSTEDVEAFGTRVLTEDIIPVTTAAGLIHRYCLSQKKTYDDAVKLLDEYQKECGTTTKQKLDEKPEFFTKNVLKKLDQKFQDDNAFKEFLKSNSSSLDVPSKTAIHIYRKLAEYFAEVYSHSRKVARNKDDLHDAIKGVLDREDTENWSLQKCQTIQKIMTSAACWYRIDYPPRVTKSGLQYVDCSHRILSNLTGDYSVLILSDPDEPQSITKADVLLLLYEIVCFSLSVYKNGDRTEFARCYYALGKNIMKQCSMEFYVPNYLEYSFLLAIASNLSIEELCEKKLFDPQWNELMKSYSEKDGKTEPGKEVTGENTEEPVMEEDDNPEEMGENTDVPVTGKSGKPGENGTGKVVKSKLSDIIKNIIRTYSPEHFNRVYVSKELLDSVAEYYEDAPVNSQILFDESGIYVIGEVKRKKVILKNLHRWKEAEENPLRTVFLKNVFVDSNGKESLYQKAETIVTEALEKKGEDLGDKKKEMWKDRTAVRLYLQIITQRIQRLYPDAELTFTVNSDKNRTIRLTNRKKRT